MNCLIENEYIQGKKTAKKKRKKNFSIHKWIAWLKTKTKGKETEKTGKTSWRTLSRGGLLIFPGSWRTLLWGVY